MTTDVWRQVVINRVRNELEQVPQVSIGVRLDECGAVWSGADVVAECVTVYAIINRFEKLTIN